MLIHAFGVLSAAVCCGLAQQICNGLMCQPQPKTCRSLTNWIGIDCTLVFPPLIPCEFIECAEGHECCIGQCRLGFCQKIYPDCSASLVDDLLPCAVDVNLGMDIRKRPQFTCDIVESVCGPGMRCCHNACGEARCELAPAINKPPLCPGADPNVAGVCIDEKYPTCEQQCGKDSPCCVNVCGAPRCLNVTFTIGTGIGPNATPATS